MKTKILLLILTVVFALTNQSCKKPIYGCTDSSALNFNPNATNNNGTCIDKVYGCTDPSANNYNFAANVDNGTCTYKGNAMFWYYASGGTDCVVTIGGYTGYINGAYYYTSTPACGAAYCANFYLPVGTYSYHAESTFSVWDGWITVTKGGCSTVYF